MVKVIDIDSDIAIASGIGIAIDSVKDIDVCYTTNDDVDDVVIDIDMVMYIPVAFAMDNIIEVVGDIDVVIGNDIDSC